MGIYGQGKERLGGSKFPCKYSWVLQFLLRVERSQGHPRPSVQL